MTFFYSSLSKEDLLLPAAALQTIPCDRIEFTPPISASYERKNAEKFLPDACVLSTT